jgi:hypothetical protein
MPAVRIMWGNQVSRCLFTAFLPANSKSSYCDAIRPGQRRKRTLTPSGPPGTLLEQNRPVTEIQQKTCTAIIFLHLLKELGQASIQFPVKKPIRPDVTVRGQRSNLRGDRFEDRFVVSLLAMTRSTKPPRVTEGLPAALPIRLTSENW